MFLSLGPGMFVVLPHARGVKWPEMLSFIADNPEQVANDRDVVTGSNDHFYCEVVVIVRSRPSRRERASLQPSAPLWPE